MFPQPVSSNSNSNQPSQNEQVKTRDCFIGWLATAGLSILADLAANNFDLSKFDKSKISVIVMSSVAGYLVRDIAPILPTKLVAPLISIWNIWDTVVGNACNYQGNAFVLGMFLKEYASSSKQSQSLQASKMTIPLLQSLYSKLKDTLDKLVISQENANSKLANVVAAHYERIFNSTPSTPSDSISLSVGKGNILLAGPSGCGKSTMIKSMATSLGLPIATIDATRLTPEGIMGPKFDEVFRKLYEQAGENKAIAECGIVVIDKADKLFKPTSQFPHSLSGIQNQVISALQGETAKFKSSDSPLVDSQSMSTKNILFILSGSFEELYANQHQTSEAASDSSFISSQDLINNGFAADFVGSLSHLIKLKPLTREDYKAILLNPYSSISIPAWKREFEKSQLSLEVEESVIDQIINYAVEVDAGARSLDFALRQLVEPIQTDCLKKIRSGELQPGTIVHINSEDWNKTSVAQQRQKSISFPSLSEIKSILEEQVVGQREAKNTVAEAIYFHFCNKTDSNNKQVPLPKSNVLLIGPSGTGKTLIMDTISEKMDIPIAHLDASRLTREGIIGPKTSDAIVSLLNQTKGNVKKAERGIIFLDEIDKVFQDTKNRNPEMGLVSGAPIQNQLLSMLQGDDVIVNYNNERKIVKTKDILFVMAGAFSHLTGGKDATITDQMLLDAGIIPEFLGRIGYISQLHPLTSQEFKETLTRGPKAPLASWTNLFEQHGAKLRVSNATLTQLAEDAKNKKTGIRAIHFELRKLLSAHLAKVIEMRSSKPDSSEPLIVVV